MYSKVIRIDGQIADDILAISKDLKISTPKASRVYLVLHPMRRKSMWSKTFPEAKVVYKRKKVLQNMAYL